MSSVSSEKHTLLSEEKKRSPPLSMQMIYVRYHLKRIHFLTCTYFLILEIQMSASVCDK